MSAPLRFRPATSADASAGGALIYATGPEFFRAVFGLGDEARAVATLCAAFARESGPFSFTLTLIAEDTTLAGLVLGYPLRARDALERAIFPLILARYKPWELPRLTARGLAAARLQAPLPDDAWYLSDLAVPPERRGAGIGRALLDEALRRASASGFSRVGLHVSSANASARALYARAGFTDLETRGDAALEKKFGFAPQVAMVRG
jgi:ribosomal protein S18 acetylase RimI-like enzyme